MSDAAIISPPRSTAVAAQGSGHARVALAFAACGLVWFILCRQLANEWSINEQYSYGWFVPFFAAYLVWLRWDDRPAARAPARSHLFLLLTSSFFLFLLLPLRLFEVGNPDWRPLGWVHAGVVVALTLCVVWTAGGWQWVKHFAFPVAFILVAVPWITPIEAPIVQGLMRIVAAISTETLALSGVPAQLEGSVIRISSGVVGVNEACSGVRSLQTSLMIGLLFGELKRLSVARRFALVAGAAAIAFIANCARAFFLVWVAAHESVAAVDQWHDTAGYAILGAVFLGTIALASSLAPKVESRNEKGETLEATDDVPASERGPSRFAIPNSYFLLCLSWLLFVEVGVEAWYRAHERNLASTPTWNVHWPESTEGFQEVKISDDVRATLRYDAGRQGSWPSGSGTSDRRLAPRESWSMFFFRWEPGTTSILRARAHRPDICLPNTGWRVSEDHGVRRFAVRDGVEMPFRHFTFIREAAHQRSVTAHAFFCQREDRVPAGNSALDITAGETSTWDRWDRWRVVLQGLRNQGQQVLELVLMTPRELSGPAAQAEFAELVPKIVSVNETPEA